MSSNIHDKDFIDAVIKTVADTGVFTKIELSPVQAIHPHDMVSDNAKPQHMGNELMATLVKGDSDTRAKAIESLTDLFDEFKCQYSWGEIGSPTLVCYLIHMKHPLTVTIESNGKGNAEELRPRGEESAE